MLYPEQKCEPRGDGDGCGKCKFVSMKRNGPTWGRFCLPPGCLAGSSLYVHSTEITALSWAPGVCLNCKLSFKHGVLSRTKGNERHSAASFCSQCLLGVRDIFLRDPSAAVPRISLARIGLSSHPWIIGQGEQDGRSWLPKPSRSAEGKKAEATSSSCVKIKPGFCSRKLLEYKF